MQNTKNKINIPLQITRILFAFLIIFELLNHWHILDFELDFTWLGLFITAVACWVILELTNSLFCKATHRHLPWFILLIGAGFVYADALADILHLYQNFDATDKILHFSAGLYIASTLNYIFYYLEKAKMFKMAPFGISLMSICFTTMFAVFYELEEYFEDIIHQTNRLGSGPDTANDMMLAFLGACLVALIINIYFKYFKK